MKTQNLPKANKTRFHQGKFNPINPQKYMGNISNIVYRSSWEYYFMNYLDISNHILKWGSEEFFIPYIKPTTNKVHKYYPDFYMEVQTKDKIQKFLVEIKPVKDTEIYSPKTQTAKSKQRVIESILTMEINKAKWQAAEEFCNKNNMIFKVITEKELFGK